MKIILNTVEGVETFISQITSAKYENSKLTLTVDVKEGIGAFVKEGYITHEVELTEEQTASLLSALSSAM